MAQGIVFINKWRPDWPLRQSSRSRPGNHGLTLVELMMAMAILGLLASAAAPSLRLFVQDQRLDQHARAFSAHMQWARSWAITSGQPVRLWIASDSTGSCYVFHTGPTLSCSCEQMPSTCLPQTPMAWHHIPRDQGIQIRPGGLSHRLTIDPAHGTVTPTMTVWVESNHGRNIRHHISLMGRIRTCTSPTPAMGYPAC